MYCSGNIVNEIKMVIYVVFLVELRLIRQKPKNENRDKK